MDDNGKLSLVDTYETFKTIGEVFAEAVSTTVATFPKTFPNEQAKFERLATEMHGWFTGSVEKLREMEALAEFESNPAQAEAYREFADWHAQQANRFLDQTIAAEAPP